MIGNFVSHVGKESLSTNNLQEEKQNEKGYYR